MTTFLKGHPDDPVPEDGAAVAFDAGEGAYRAIDLDAAVAALVADEGSALRAALESLITDMTE